jgi:GT2 family glycosyltransferase
MATRVAVVIVNWNGQHFLERCLSAVLAQTFRSVEVVMVDNGSTDQSVPFVKGRFPQVRLISNDKNRGFAAATNQAIRATDSEFVAALNNDTQATPTWLEELVRVAETDARVGACASRILFADRPDIINSAGIGLDRAGLAWDWRGGERDDGTDPAPVEVFGACAGAALYRRAMLEDVGLFDEDFFLYLEDVDLAWRARWAGWKTVSVPAARVMHWHSGTAVEGSYFKRRLIGRNRIWLVAKNYPWPQLAWYLPAILVYDLAVLPHALISCRNWGPLRGRLEGLTSLSRAIRERRKARSYHRVSAREVLAWMAPLPTPRALWRRYGHLTARARRPW